MIRKKQVRDILTLYNIIQQFTPYMKYIIYEIKSLNSLITYSYIGSTKNFRDRKSRHKRSCNNEKEKNHNLKVYKFIRENGGWDAFDIIPLEEYDCENTIQARIREQFWIDKRKDNLNTFRAYNNEDFNNNYNKQYRENNKEKLLKYQEEYRKDNSDDLLEKKKEYYLKNKLKINEKHNEKVECDCGLTYTLGHKSRHLKSSSHIKGLSCKIDKFNES